MYKRHDTWLKNDGSMLTREFKRMSNKLTLFVWFKIIYDQEVLEDPVQQYHIMGILMLHAQDIKEMTLIRFFYTFHTKWSMVKG